MAQRVENQYGIENQKHLETLIEDVNKEVSVLTDHNSHSFATDQTKVALHDGIVNISATTPSRVNLDQSAEVLLP